MRYTYYIGIDCGVHTGLCIWSTRQKSISHIHTLKIHEAMETVRKWHQTWGGQLFVRIEDARLRTWIPYQKNEKAERGRREGAGSVKRDAKIWEDFLTDLGVPFEMVAPKRNKTKVDAEYFKKLTGYTGKTSEHARDAAGLVIGM
jgi:hypothetical protein